VVHPFFFYFRSLTIPLSLAFSPLVTRSLFLCLSSFLRIAFDVLSVALPALAKAIINRTTPRLTPAARWQPPGSPADHPIEIEKLRDERSVEQLSKKETPDKVEDHGGVSRTSSRLLSEVLILRIEY